MLTKSYVDMWDTSKTFPHALNEMGNCLVS